MNHRVVMPEAEWIEIKRHLFHSDVEEAALVFATTTITENGVVFSFCTKMCLGPEAFKIHSAYHIELEDEARAHIIKTAWDLKASIIEFHSHVGPHSVAAFSPSDLAGFEDFLPHVWWRLRGRPYAAIVMSAAEFDALVWARDPRVAESLSVVSLEGAELTPTGATQEWLNSAAL